MRLGIFAACVVSLILICRFYSLPAAQEVSEKESVPSVAMAVYDEPIGNRLIPGPNHFLDDSDCDQGLLQLADPAERKFSTLQTARALSSTTGNDRYSVAKPKFDTNAMNVQLLVRAQYEIPKSAAELLMKLDTDRLVETTELESEHPDIAILQVTTDEETQKQFAGFLSALYPPASIEKLRDRSADRER